MLAKLDFTHSDGDGNIHARLLDEFGESIGMFTLSKDQALDAMAEIAIAIRQEYGTFKAIDPANIAKGGIEF